MPDERRAGQLENETQEQIGCEPSCKLLIASLLLYLLLS